MSSKELTLGTLFKGKMDPTFKQALNAIKSGIENLSGVTGKATSSTQKLTKASKDMWPVINKVNNAIDEGRMSWQDAAVQQAKYQTLTSKTTKSLKEAQFAVNNFSKQKSQLSSELKSGNITLSDAAKKLRTITDNYNGAVPASQRLAASTQKTIEPFRFLGKQIGSVNGAVDRLKAAFKVTAAYGAASTAIYSLITAFRSGGQAIVDYDQSLKNLQAITSATEAEVGVMGETIKDVARTTKFSASEVADGMVLLGQSGFDAGESMNAMQATANLATGTLSDMKTTADLLTTTIRAFNLDTIESGRVSDVMANAVNKSKLTIDKLRTAFNYVGATAAQTGMSIEETAASAMVLANNGLRASTIGTGLRQVLARLLSPNAKLREAYEAHGIALDSVNPRVVGYQNALKQLSVVLYDSEAKTIDSSRAFELFGLRGAQAATVLTKEFISGNFNAALDNVFKVGTAADMAGLQIQGLGLMLKNLVDRAKNVAIALGEGSGLTGAMKAAVSTLQSLMGGLESFVGGTLGGAIVQFGLLTAGIAALRGAIVFLTSAIAGLSIVQTVTTNFKMLTLAMELQGATMVGLAGVLNKLKAAFIVLWTVVRAHPFAAITAVIAAVVVTINSLSGASGKLARKLSEQAVQLKVSANAMTLYSAALSKTEKGSNESSAALQRLQSEHPKLVQEILKMNNALDLADIATKDLVDSMKELAKVKAYESIKATGEVLKIQRQRYDEATSATNLSKKALKEFLEQGTLLTDDFLPALKSVTEAEKALSKAQMGHAQSIKALVDMGAISKAQAYEMVDAMKLEAAESAKLKQAFEKHFIAIADGGRNTVSKFKDVFGELPPYFAQLYSELDSLRQADFAKAVDSMNREVAAHKKRSQDMGIDQYELEEQIKAIRQKAYDDFVASHDKETQAKAKALQKQEDELRKSLEKQQTEYQKFADKVKSIEEKLAEDKKKIRQADMTDEAKMQDDLLLARAALAEAIKAVSEAETDKEREEALKKIETARALYSAIASSADSASTKKIKSEERVTAAAKAEATKQVENAKSAHEQLLQAYKAISTKNEGVFRDFSQTRQNIENTEIANMTEQRNKFAQEDLARIKKTYGENSEQVRRFMEAEIRYYGEAKAAKMYGLDEVAKYTKEKAEEGATAQKNSYESVKKAAEDAFGVIETLLTNLKDKFQDPAKLQVDTAESGAKLDDIVDKAEAAKKAITDDKEFNLDAEKAKTDTETIDTNAKKVSAEAERPKTYTLDAANAILNTKKLYESVATFNGLLAAVQGMLGDVSFKALVVSENITKYLTDAAKETATSFNTTFTGIKLGLSAIASRASTSASTMAGAFERAVERIKTAIKSIASVKIDITVNSKSGGGGGGSGADQTSSGIYESNKAKMSTGGKLSGYGGGDTVPAMLEPGEFVFRKEAVKKYGANFLASMNSMAAGMKLGGFVPKVRMPRFSDGGSVGVSRGLQLSNQLHTINLNINSKAHTLYGDEQAVRGLVKTLRREQLVTA